MNEVFTDILRWALDCSSCPSPVVVELHPARPVSVYYWMTHNTRLYFTVSSKGRTVRVVIHPRTQRLDQRKVRSEIAHSDFERAMGGIREVDVSSHFDRRKSVEQ